MTASTAGRLRRTSSGGTSFVTVPLGATYGALGRFDIRGALDESPWAWAVIGLGVLVALTSIFFVVVIVRDIRRAAR